MRPRSPRPAAGARHRAVGAGGVAPDDAPRVRVLDGMAAVHADVLAAALGAGETVRHVDRAETIRGLGHAERAVEVEQALAEIQRARSGLRLNPLAELWVEGLLDRLAMLRRGQQPPRHAPGLAVG